MVTYHTVFHPKTFVSRGLQLPIAPYRDLGELGVSTDADPYNNKFSQFTFASNARFEDKRIQRGPVFSISGTLAANTSPRYVMSYKQLTGSAQYHIANRDGTVTNWSALGTGGASTETDITAAGWTPANYDAPYTGCILNDIVYLNRVDRAPWFKAKNGASFAALTNWPSNYRAGAFREVGGVLVALNITQSGVSYPTMVMTSDYMLFGTVPGTWTPSTSNSATYQVIADLSEPLIDGVNLRDRLILYTENETWSMEPRYDALMFNYRRLFDNSGIINQNCAASYNNIHYVFGSQDIWQHDGFQRKSIAAGRVRDFIFQNMDKTQSSLFFTVHNPRLSEVMFCYVSKDSYCAFPPTTTLTGCNRAAVYNYRADTWYFYDLPYVVSSGLGVPVTGASYTTETGIAYSSLAGSYSSFGDSTKFSLMFVSPPATGTYGTLSCAVRSFDKAGATANNGLLDPPANAPVYIENTGIDLDDLHAELRGYKVVKAIYPEGRFDPGAQPMTFTFLSRDYPNSQTYVTLPSQTFDGSTAYKLDFRASGRYLDMQITYNDVKNFSFMGFDFDFAQIGHR